MNFDLDRLAMEHVEHREPSFYRYDNSTLYVGVGQCVLYMENFKIDKPKSKPYVTKINE